MHMPKTTSVQSLVVSWQTGLKSLLLPAAAGLIFSWHNALGVELIKVTVEVDHDRYHVFGQSLIDASPEFIYETLMDYDNFHKLASGIADTSFLPPDESGQLLAYTRFESCVLFFCKTVEKTEHIDGNPNNSIHARAIPEISDFIFNESSWQIEKAGDQTLLTYEAEFETKFWIPPLIGPWAVRRKLTRTAELIGTRIEWMYDRGLTLAQVQE